ncbi:MAG: hypothetical protein CME06_14175 [Gemmatimonadetes bacterium]|nr:hypothetical protein [Gemmatimonadota bacterium]
MHDLLSATLVLTLTLSGDSQLPPGHATDSVVAQSMQALLNEPEGWRLHAEKGRVRVFQKKIEPLDLTAYMGRMVLSPEATPDALFGALADVDRHPEFNNILVDSRRLSWDGNMRDLCQIMRGPRFVPIAKRFWFSRSIESRNVDGTPGHHRSAWLRLPPTAYPEIRAEFAERYRGAVEVPLSFGSWESRPLSEGVFELTFRTVSDPGGSVPNFLANWATRGALPENMLKLEAAAIERARGLAENEQGGGDPW